MPKNWKTSCPAILSWGWVQEAVHRLIWYCSLQYTDPSKTSRPQRAGCPREDPRSKEALRCTLSQICSTCTDISNQSSPSLCPLHWCQVSWPFTSPTHPTNALCCSALAEHKATPAPSQPLSTSATGRQKQHTSALVQACRGPSRAASTRVTSPGTCLYSWENVEKYLWPPNIYLLIGGFQCCCSVLKLRCS